jgi:SNF2 family DNA or RNA helicase
MRRVKRDVLDDLPEKTEITIPVILGDEERAGYEACRRMALESLQSSGTDNRISILAELTRLRRYCCHPSLVVGDGISASATMAALLELLANLRENGHRALIFSQFTDYLAIVRKTVESQGWNSLYLDGQTPAVERSRLVDAFQRGEGDFFLISLKAGGMGLNLTAANYVILLDPWWNPAVENQAADRVHRIGQKNPVTVYRLIASKTVEERVIELHGTKRQIAEDVLDGSASASLTPDELMKLFQ